jgi:hypothetical protein
VEEISYEVGTTRLFKEVVKRVVEEVIRDENKEVIN